MKVRASISIKGYLIINTVFLCIIGGLVYKGVYALSEQHAEAFFRHGLGARL